MTTKELVEKIEDLGDIKGHTLVVSVADNLRPSQEQRIKERFARIQKKTKACFIFVPSYVKIEKYDEPPMENGQ